MNEKFYRFRSIWGSSLSQRASSAGEANHPSPPPPHKYRAGSIPAFNITYCTNIHEYTTELYWHTQAKLFNSKFICSLKIFTFISLNF